MIELKKKKKKKGVAPPQYHSICITDLNVKATQWRQLGKTNEIAGMVIKHCIEIKPAPIHFSLLVQLGF